MKFALLFPFLTLAVPMQASPLLANENQTCPVRIDAISVQANFDIHKVSNCIFIIIMLNSDIE